jgi:hypothetical protein
MVFSAHLNEHANMRRSTIPPHLISVGRIKRCSECGREFPLDVKPSLGRAFVEHVRNEHQRKVKSARSGA